MNFLPILFLFLLVACGGSSSTSTGSSAAVFSNADWRLVTSYNVQAGITYDGELGTLTIANNNGVTMGMPSLFIFDTDTGEESSVSITGGNTITDGTTYTGTFTHPGGSEPDTGAFFGMSLGDNTVGQFVTTSAFEDLPLSIQDGPDVDTDTSGLLMMGSNIIPSTGTWNLSISGSTGDVSCVTGVASFASSGEVTLNVSCNGYSMNMLADSTLVSFDLTSSSGVYESPEYSFPVRDEDDNILYGDVSYTLNASSSSAMTGTLDFDNSLGCTASYPTTMELQTATSPIINNICNGTWTFEYGTPTFLCGTTTFAYSLLSFAPLTIGTVTTIENSAGAPLAATYSYSGGSVFLYRQGCTNNYGNMIAPQVFGTAIDGSGFPVIFKMGLQAYASSDNSFVGMGLIEGIGTDPLSPYTCAATFPFTMTAVPSC